MEPLLYAHFLTVIFVVCVWGVLGKITCFYLGGMTELAKLARHPAASCLSSLRNKKSKIQHYMKS